MKKIILILLLLIWLLTSCNKYITTNVYEKKYTDETVALVDVYTHLYYYELDSIYLDRWITNNMLYDSISIQQKTIRKIVNKKSTYTFVLSKYVYPSTSYYNFLIRFSGNKKDLRY